MEFESRKQQRVVNETMSDLLSGLKNHCNDKTRECISITLRILSSIPVKNENIKTLDQVQKEIDFGDVYTREEFENLVKDGMFIPYDGSGYFHDGVNERSNISVWKHYRYDKNGEMYVDGDVTMYPYVCWYNK